MLDPSVQFGKLVTKARYKQKLRLEASRTNSLFELKSVESRHYNITHHKVYCAIMLMAQAEGLWHLAKLPILERLELTGANKAITERGIVFLGRVKTRLLAALHLKRS